jgi:adenine-specific DNA-methyltransferase
MTMRKLGADDPGTRSRDLVAENVQRMKALFPELVTEGPNGASVNVDVLRELVGDATVSGADEKYGLDWHGKRRAHQLALMPSTGTLRPCPEDSVEWGTTQNLLIEGDNLEVLKLLQKSYAGKVKLIYIDPPYNTGTDFVYPDNFQDSIKSYLELTGQVEGGAKISSNTEASGRFHTDWLNMMYPRLKIAYSLLRKDGVLFVSIDDGEAPRLRLLCDEVCGPENFIAQMVWEGANKNTASQIGTVHEYVLVYARHRDALPREWGLKKEGVDRVLAEVDRLKAKHGDDHANASQELAGWFRAMKATPCFGLRRFRYIDDRGAYKEDDPTAPGGRRFDLIDPRNGNVIPLRRNRGWGFDQTEFERLVREGRISFVTETSIMVRRYLHETETVTPPSVLYQPARSASERLTRLMGEPVFDFPKDETVLSTFIEMSTERTDDDLVLDFFAGSGSTGHSVMAQNAVDGGKRRYILVQLPEPLDPENKDQKVAAEFCDRLGKPRNLAELTKERLRRAARKIKGETPMFAGDHGFRVFKLDSSNIGSWEPDRDALEKTLLDSVEHLKPGRTEADVRYELLLKLGLDLCVPMETRAVIGKDVHAVGGGVLMTCLAGRIERDDVEALAQGIVQWHQELAPAGETTCVFRDSAFADDVAKTNLAAILEQHGIANIRSL